MIKSSSKLFSSYYSCIPTALSLTATLPHLPEGCVDGRRGSASISTWRNHAELAHDGRGGDQDPRRQGKLVGVGWGGAGRGGAGRDELRSSRREHKEAEGGQRRRNAQEAAHGCGRDLGSELLTLARREE